MMARGKSQNFRREHGLWIELYPSEKGGLGDPSTCECDLT